VMFVPIPPKTTLLNTLKASTPALSRTSRKRKVRRRLRSWLNELGFRSPKGSVRGVVP
jgi:hypothetical protein